VRNTALVGGTKSSLGPNGPAPGHGLDGKTPVWMLGETLDGAPRYEIRDETSSQEIWGHAVPSHLYRTRRTSYVACRSYESFGYANYEVEVAGEE